MALHHSNASTTRHMTASDFSYMTQIQRRSSVDLCRAAPAVLWSPASLHTHQMAAGSWFAFFIYLLSLFHSTQPNEMCWVDISRHQPKCFIIPVICSRPRFIFVSVLYWIKQNVTPSWLMCQDDFDHQCEESFSFVLRMWNFHGGCTVISSHPNAVSWLHTNGEGCRINQATHHQLMINSVSIHVFFCRFCIFSIFFLVKNELFFHKINVHSYFFFLTCSRYPICKNNVGPYSLWFTSEQPTHWFKRKYDDEPSS